ncbi:YusW family protein [Thalassorhabdus alkalitolerans]|uniref:YusW family protein n=1 Tax=Thalassorhabdus alkalitolerans TaxID=2282697 RepID=A0ABW0YML2_9BACI
MKKFTRGAVFFLAVMLTFMSTGCNGGDAAGQGGNQAGNQAGNQTGMNAQDNFGGQAFQTNVDNIREFDLEVRTIYDDEVEWEYKRTTNDVDAKVEHEHGEEADQGGDWAVQHMEEMLAQLNVSSQMSEAQIADEVLAVFGLVPEEINDFGLEITFADGTEIEIERLS